MSSRSDVSRRIGGLIEAFIGSAVMTNERIARSLGLNVVDLQALGVLTRADHPLTAGELSQRTELPTSTTTRVIDRLERGGFIERAPDPADRRRVVLHPTPGKLGRGGDGDPYAGLAAHMEAVNGGFTVAELEVVARYLTETLADS